MLCKDRTSSEQVLVAVTMAWANWLRAGFPELSSVIRDHMILTDNLVPFSFLVSTLGSDWGRTNLA